MTRFAWEAGDVHVDDLKIHYYRTGSAKPPLVLVHGFTDDGLCWTPVAEILSQTYDVIMVDARGHGFSDAPERGYSPTDQASDLHGVILALNLKKPAVLGHSMGAITAMVLAGTYPDLPGAILLEDPPPFWLSPAVSASYDSEWRERTVQRLTEVKTKTRAQLIDSQHHASPNWSDLELGCWADSKLRLSLNIAQFTDPRTAVSVDWTALLPIIKCPALLLTADPALGAIVTPEAQDMLKAMIPQLQVEHISGAGHSIRREQFTSYLDIVSRVLKDLHLGLTK